MPGFMPSQQHAYRLHHSQFVLRDYHCNIAMH